MDIIYWNIGSGITPEKTAWVKSLIGERSPDILCIAEGPRSNPDTETFVADICGLGYKNYYSPTFYDETLIANQYGWNPYGLKVFVKQDVKLKTHFAFSNQQLEGRIIYLRREMGGQNYSIFLLHGKSKAGHELHQNDFIIELSLFIAAKLRGREADKIALIGDFNTEPWNELLSNKKYIYSFFYKKPFDYFSSSVISRIYYNPILDYLQSHPDPLLFGTFYNKNFISALDYPLFNHDFTNYQLELITNINGKILFIRKASKDLLADQFDHLPLIIKIV